MAAEAVEAKQPCHGQVVVVARHQHRPHHVPCGPNRDPQARIDFGCEKFDFAFSLSGISSRHHYGACGHARRLWPARDMVQPMLVPCYNLAMAGLFVFSRADMRRLAAVGGGDTLGTRGRAEVRRRRRQ
jgi:hypothetical protein